MSEYTALQADAREARDRMQQLEREANNAREALSDARAANAALREGLKRYERDELLDSHAILVRALLGPQHARAWQNDAEFRATVTNLARLLPAWIDGLLAAGEAQRRFVAQQVRIAKLMTPEVTVEDAAHLFLGSPRDPTA